MREIDLKKACVIGWPIKHSRSPMIHNYWLQKYNISGAYAKEAISPEHLASFIEQLSINGFQGCNVTIPHKEEVFKLVSISDTVTQKIKAVNTVFYKDGKLCGTNTDGYGFLSNLKMTLPSWEFNQKTSIIIGAGGAARAIIASLIDEGAAKIFLVNRTKSRAQKLAKEFGSTINAKSMDELEDCMKEADLLVNTTSLGMAGQPSLQISLTNLKSDCVVYDIVYAPLETELLKQAQNHGYPTIDGLGMLLHQAVPGFEKWFGVKPEVTTELRELIVKDLMKDLSL